MPGMPGMPGQQAPQSDLDIFFDEFRSNRQIDELVQQMQMRGYADSVILDTIYKEFDNELVYSARKLVQKQVAPQQQGMPGMPGMPGMQGQQ